MGDVMAFDHDLDASFLAEDEERLLACREELLQLGIDLRLERTSIFFHGVKIGDFERWRRRDGVLYRSEPSERTAVLKVVNAAVDDFPVRWIEPLWQIEFNGAMYPCPNHPDRLLKRRYPTTRFHLRLAVPHKQRCWWSPAFWRESWRIWNFKGAPKILETPP